MRTSCDERVSAAGAAYWHARSCIGRSHDVDARVAEHLSGRDQCAWPCEPKSASHSPPARRFTPARTRAEAPAHAAGSARSGAPRRRHRSRAIPVLPAAGLPAEDQHPAFECEPMVAAFHEPRSPVPDRGRASRFQSSGGRPQATPRISSQPALRTGEARGASVRRPACSWSSRAAPTVTTDTAGAAAHAQPRPCDRGRAPVRSDDAREWLDPSFATTTERITERAYASRSRRGARPVRRAAAAPTRAQRRSRGRTERVRGRR